MNNSLKNSKVGAKVVVAMSGGVDSSMAAKLLVDAGYAVVGITMKLWGYKDSGGNVVEDSNCCSLDDIHNAAIVCTQLGIPHYTLDYSEKFREMVVKNFVEEYKRGRTPNPCVLCNTEMKWRALLEKVDDLGADYIATGHYARKVRNPETGAWRIARARDEKKDQSYVLWGIQPDGLAQTLFPLGDLTKDEIRALAAASNLRTAHTPESQDICFIPDNDYRRFLKEKHATDLVDVAPGDIMDMHGEKLGEHKGIPFYTVGQRKGLGLATGEPMFVTQIDKERNTIRVGHREETLSETFLVEDLNWFEEVPAGESVRVFAHIRYNHPGEWATVTVETDGVARVVYDNPQAAITPGQSAVFYQEDQVLGGGHIKEVVFEKESVEIEV
ncbi:MAG: tRNA 2-thiouridine(34) synthase MnmA [Candidatus Marinimicrobia bacterium]|nr:tRNA 2-thiouridine(34) synthase MnmA [Candidatus Neomarinimicrobiota bacterium]MCF7840385.1 tRNA 2-thiouridine(34) synthase MnmA [Candidatus Neomarinimicrobiota bacterium]MCF7901976.1 tRNA 2-thiouridine(34) synthase MnmA [Candidatus Neomarinimicrobiota bacterium]